MLATIRETFGLMKTSYRVLMLDRELLVFPLSAACSVLGMLALVVLVGSGTGTLTDAADDPYSGSSLVLVFLFLFGSTAITIFFNAALVAGALNRLRGGDPTIRSSLAAAARRLPQLFAWALISTIVAILLRALRGRRGRQGALAGAIAARLGGVAWSLATFFVVPIILDEGAGPVTAIRRSASLLRDTWGQQLAGGAAFGLLDFAVWAVGGWLAFALFDVHPFLGLCAGCPCSCFCAES